MLGPIVCPRSLFLQLELALIVGIIPLISLDWLQISNNGGTNFRSLKLILSVVNWHHLTVFSFNSWVQDESLVFLDLVGKRHDGCCISFPVQIDHGVINANIVKCEYILNTVSKHALHDKFHKLRFLEIVCSLDDCAAKTAGEEPIDLLIVFYDALLNQIVIQESPFQNQ